MRGAGPGFGVSTSRGSTGMSSATGAAPLTANFASAQFAATARLPSTGFTWSTNVLMPRTSTLTGSARIAAHDGLAHVEHAAVADDAKDDRGWRHRAQRRADRPPRVVPDGGLSSAPTIAENCSAPPARCTNSTLVARVPTPAANTLPEIRIGSPSIDLFACATVCAAPPRHRRARRASSSDRACRVERRSPANGSPRRRETASPRRPLREVVFRQRNVS